jgi:hypothetical protein
VLNSAGAGAGVGAKTSEEDKAKNGTESTGSSSISPHKSLSNSASSSSSSYSSSSSSSSSSSLAHATQSMKSVSLMTKKKSPSILASIKSLTKPGLPSKKALQSNASKSIVRKKSKKPCKLTKKAKSVLATKCRFSLALREDKKMKKIKPLRANITVPGGAAIELKDGVASALCPEEKEKDKDKECAASKECSLAPPPLPPPVAVAAAAREVTAAATAVTGAESMRGDRSPADAAAAQRTQSLISTKTVIKAKQVKRKTAPGRAIMTGTTIKKVAAIMAVRNSETIRSAQSPAPLSAPVTGTTSMKSPSIVKVKTTPPSVLTSAHVPPTSNASPILTTHPLSHLVSSSSISAPALHLSPPVPPVPILVLSRPLELPLSAHALSLPVSTSLHVSTPPLPVSIPLRPITTLPSEIAGSHPSLSHSTALLLPIHKTNILIEKQKRVRKPVNIKAAVPPVQAYVLPGTLGIRKSPLQKVERPSESTLQTGKPSGNLLPTSECISALNSYFAGSGSGSGSSGVGLNSTKNTHSDSHVQIILNKKIEKDSMLLKGAANSELLLSDQNTECVSKKDIIDGIDDVALMQCAVRERDRTPDTAHEDKGISNDGDGGDGLLRAIECSPPRDLHSCAVHLTDDETPEKGRYFNTPPQFLDSDFPRS